VLVTAHQAFFTAEALNEIALTTFENIRQLLNGYEISHKGALLC
jgi:D-lactate dehydrogenase